jgi:hypothetical protein
LEETRPCGNAERNPCHERSSGENPNGNTGQINMAGLFQIEYVIFYTKHGSKHAGNGRASLTIQCSPPQSGRTPTKEVGARRGLGNRQRTVHASWHHVVRMDVTLMFALNPLTSCFLAKKQSEPPLKTRRPLGIVRIAQAFKLVWVLWRNNVM